MNMKWGSRWSGPNEPQAQATILDETLGILFQVMTEWFSALKWSSS